MKSTRLKWGFLAAYTLSGLAGLIYQVTWTRLLTLYMGQSIVAASTVVAAFMGGLAAGSALAGLFAQRLTPRQGLYAYAGLEVVVIVGALALPLELAALRPLLAWAYQGEGAGLLFAAIRLIACLVAILIPATALGATFPTAVRAFMGDRGHPGRDAGQLYTVNTLGAAIGVLVAGFALIPAIGISGTTWVGIAVSGLAIACVLWIVRNYPDEPQIAMNEAQPAGGKKRSRTAEDRKRRRAPLAPPADAPSMPRIWLAAAVLGLSGFATLLYEIAWTRIFSLVIGPTTYAFAATVAALIAGIAVGSAFGSWVAGRARHQALWLTCALAGTAIAVNAATSFVGRDVPRLVAERLASSPELVDPLLTLHVPLIASLILPAALGLGVAFPLALNIVGLQEPITRRLGLVYAVNTLGAVAGSLFAGLVVIPQFGLQQTLHIVSGILVLDAFLVLAFGGASRRGWVVAALPLVGAVVLLMLSPPWDRDLLASGAYKYARQVPVNADLETALKAGTLLYYRDGAASTVSVKRLTGALSLSIDGKVDASNSGDMLTQKALGHLPLLLHGNPRDVLVIGLGSGVTVASALAHPITRLDVVEISPEVVEASSYFSADTGQPLDDPRTRLILGDGRSHLLLSNRNYDAIISEPSNPWMAGVAALFTREFFAAARARLAPDGIICQWAHTYDISDEDLRSIVATFLSVFPHGTMWLIGEGDVLLVASTNPMDSRLENLGRSWQRPGVATDLSKVSANEPFAFLSMLAGGPQELRRYAARAALQTDDRMALEFSGPHALYNRADRNNASALRQLWQSDRRPRAIDESLKRAGAVQWRDRGAMLFKADAYADAYTSYKQALMINPTDRDALEAFATAAVAAQREAEALDWFKSSIEKYPREAVIRVAMSKLLAATNADEEAEAIAVDALNIDGANSLVLEQLASILSDRGDATRLAEIVTRLYEIQPGAARTYYYDAASNFLQGKLNEAVRLARSAAALDSGYAAAYNLIGASYANLGQHEAARRAFHDALRLDPRDSATYVNLGLLELASENRRAAAAYFIEALSLDPESAAALEGLGRARPGGPTH